MITQHRIVFQNAKEMMGMSDNSVDLVVTSPPYPMIQMWDGIFAEQDGKIGEALKKGDGPRAFELMHRQLDSVWEELWRVLKEGGIACINIGDATRTIDGRFALYTNHTRILACMLKLGFSALPCILWRKQTNAPNKFMGSGMMPPGAYVTLEHEYVLILRKGNKREFKTDAEKRLRRESAFFWEERNVWFSDVWMDLKGASQKLFDKKTRNRSAAFPFELPYRLVSMFSVKGDLVLDPFLGIGTTMYAAMAAGRNSVGYEIDHGLGEIMLSKCNGVVAFSNDRIAERLNGHLAFIEKRNGRGKLKHVNRHYLFPVMTRPESDLIINELALVNRTEDNTFEVIYSDAPQRDFTGVLDPHMITDSGMEKSQKPRGSKKRKIKQRELFN